jgi:hypothetical protein
MATLASSAVLKPSARPNGLLSVLNPLPEGWERGLDVLPGSVLAPVCLGPCAGQTGNAQEPGEVTRFTPVQISQYVYCSALGRPDVSGYARSGVEVSIGYALSSVLVTGTCTENPQLQEATDVGDATSAADAICQLEDALESRLYGRLGVIHVPLGHACSLGDTVYRDTRNGRPVLRTWAGNLVAIHGTGDVVYGTGELWGSWTTAQTTEYTDRSINTTEARSDIIGMVVFDPAINISVNISG